MNDFYSKNNILEDFKSKKNENLLYRYGNNVDLDKLMSSFPFS
jgi:hypothetical protein